MRSRQRISRSRPSASAAASSGASSSASIRAVTSSSAGEASLTASPAGTGSTASAPETAAGAVSSSSAAILSGRSSSTTARKVRYIGLSDVPAWVTAEAHTIAQFRGWTPVTALQLEYSLLERTPEGELLPMAENLGIGVLPWSPLRGGQLSGKYVRNNGTPADSRRTRLTEGPTDRDWTVIETVARLAAELGVGSAEVALAWVRSRPAVTPHSSEPARSNSYGPISPRSRPLSHPSNSQL